MLRNNERCAGSALAIAFGHIAYGVPDIEHGATALVGLNGPRSRGSLALDPADPLGRPVIDPALLSDERDRSVARVGVEIARSVATCRALAPYGLTELAPGADEADLDAAIAQVAGSFMHPVGTCRLGEDPTAVVDGELVVRGFENLRVADPRVIPRIPAAATSVAVQPIGWRLGEKLAG